MSAQILVRFFFTALFTDIDHFQQFEWFSVSVDANLNQKIMLWNLFWFEKITLKVVAIEPFALINALDILQTLTFYLNEFPGKIVPLQVHIGSIRVFYCPAKLSCAARKQL